MENGEQQVVAVDPGRTSRNTFQEAPSFLEGRKGEAAC